jgi:hypothetical protein
MKPLYTLSKDVQVGIWDNCEMTARIYPDKIIVIEPYVRWIGNSGNLAEAKKSIRNPQTVAEIIANMADDCDDCDDCEDTAWELIDRAISY